MAQRDFRTRLAKRSARINLRLADDLLDRLVAYYELLERWNRKINLTALDDPDEAVDRLLLEPVVAARTISLGRGALLDVGSGGGSPAIPMKLAAPEMHLTMVEAKARKSAFLREACRHLQLAHTTVETARYEELLTRPELHEHFDFVSVRAVRVESRVLTSLQAFLKPLGTLVLFRGPSGPDEPPLIVPPLEFTATYPLVDTLRSRLTAMTKRPVGSSWGTERGL